MRSDAAGKFGEGALNVCTACYAAKGGQEQGEKQIWRGMFLQLQIGSLLGDGGPREAKRSPPSPSTGPINEREPNRAISISQQPGRLFLAVTAVFVRSGESSLLPSPPLPGVGSPGRW